LSKDSLFDYPSEREEDLQPLWSLDKAKPKATTEEEIKQLRFSRKREMLL
jgi:hypothetical protein